MKKLSELEIIRNTLNDIIESGKVRSFDIEEDVLRPNNNIDFQSTHKERIESIVNYIKLNLDHRDRVRTDELSKSLDAKALFYGYDVIKCSSGRGYGSTSAIVEMFDIDRDIYIGLNNSCISNFKDMMRKRYPERKDISKITYVNFNTVNHTNTKLDEDIKRRLNDYLKNVQMIKIDKSDDSYTSKIIRSDDIVEVLDSSGSGACIHSLRGKRLHNQAKVFIDLDIQVQVNFSLKLEKIIDEIRLLNHYNSNSNVVYIYM